MNSFTPCITLAILAQAMGFSAQAGYDLYQGCISRYQHNWSEERFCDWFFLMQCLHGNTSITGHQLSELYKRCKKISELK
ncbi:MAG TPA: hypothetical protein V6D33_07130 [Cyanophyceae cyanobacterium]